VHGKTFHPTSYVLQNKSAFDFEPQTIGSDGRADAASMKGLVVEVLCPSHAVEERAA